ncbi:MAG: BREX-1 system adenine-specific DNA-methyltransferase PglX [Bacteroidetes bacterium]|nr:BREX-1 system adenine-specific DNA-methyltransferase PglX [Bacteroidota bacterium]
MILPKVLTPRQSLNKAYLKEKILRSEIDLFKDNLNKLFEKIDHEEREENAKTILRDFLNDTYYKENHFINTLRDIDLVIYLENNQNKAAILAEVKRPKNKLEMITKDNLNAKAMHELILYYLEERIDYKNNDIKFLIATNIYEWFIFDATIFEHLFFKNKSLIKNYERWRDKQKTSGNTDLFYNEIAKPFLDELKSEIPFTYFDLNDYKKIFDKTDEESKKKKIALYKILSPAHLLKQPFTNDSNSLDRNFYNELLHIIGLIETKEKNKKLINRKPKKERDPGSIIENAILILETENTLAKINNPEKYGETNNDQLYNLALELSITWINRILFLKLLEAQLYKYHEDDKYKFLNKTIVKDFDELYKLFHQVLAISTEERTELINKKFKLVPYLNSSLFEISDLESETIKVNSLDDNTPIDLYKNTVLKDKTGKKRYEKLPALHYLFEFLDAYDFTSEGKEEIREDKKTLINASVLGLIFEKINGYKDGSFFTPGFITMYMCRETLRRAVVQKFNDKYDWECETLDDIKNNLAQRRNTSDILEFNSVINSIKICDPAVGSGHFLVSALNELIAIKSELGLLADSNGILLSDYEAKVENDELIITYNNGEDIFEYHPPKDKRSGSSNKLQRVQETLFNEKQTIIENCLFGVDINPNSVKIARLRLWIELLKNAFYTKKSSYTELETLPNIDINIKEGNSLISRFDLHDKEANILDSTRQKIRLATVKYKEQVFIYKSTNDKATKDAARKNIKQIKDSFALMANPIDKEYKRLKELENSLVQEVLSFDRESVEHWNKKRKKDQDEYDKLKIEYDNKLKTLYHNAFEWRFEFPEVLNDDGKFVGFDIVIGNPPYGVEFSLDEKNIFKQKFISNIGEFEAYTFFIEIALKYITNSKGILSFITSNTWFYLDKFFPLRKDIILNCSLDTLIELEKQVFTDAPDIVPAIFSINKTESTKSTKLFKAESTQRIYDLTDFNLFTKNVVPQKIFLHSKSCILNTKIDLKKDSLLEKLAAFLPIKNYYKVVYGIKTGDNKSNLSIDIKKSGNWRKCASSANNISKYVINWKGDYLNVGPHLDGLNNINYEQPKILIQYIRKISMPIRLVCALDNEGEYYPLNNFSFIISDKGNSLAFLLGILNSKLMNWYFANTYIDYNIKPKYIEQLPFNMNKVIQKPIEKMINKIIGLKMNIPDSDTNKLESEIDKLVYQLYGLTEEEIKIIENN